MPTAAPRICRRSGCQMLTAHGSTYCQRHMEIAAAAKGLTNAWRRSKRFLDARRIFMEIHCTCARCGQPSKILDHVIPHQGDEKLFWGEKNWQALCEACHVKKTNIEDHGGWSD